jgi:energy-coupling factor transport system substrate-specific component
MASTTSEKMKVKDIITVTLLTVCNVVIFFGCSFLYVVPVMILLSPVIMALLEGIVFMMIGTKVPKKGAILLHCVIMGLAGMNLIYAAGSIIVGIIGELMLSKTGYGNRLTLGITYALWQAVCCFTSIVYPYTIAFESTKEKIAATGADISIYEKASSMLNVGVSAGVVALTAAAAVIGAFIGSKMMKKHLVSA